MHSINNVFSSFSVGGEKKVRGGVMNLGLIPCINNCLLKTFSFQNFLFFLHFIFCILSKISQISVSLLNLVLSLKKKKIWSQTQFGHTCNFRLLLFLKREKGQGGGIEKSLQQTSKRGFYGLGGAEARNQFVGVLVGGRVGWGDGDVVCQMNKLIKYKYQLYNTNNNNNK